MKKLTLILLALFGFLPAMVKADDEVMGTFANASSGTTSATVFIKPSKTFQNITDLAWKLDSGVTSGFIAFRYGEVKYAMSSATVGSGTVVWFANANTNVAVDDTVIIYDESTGDYLLRTVRAATTTSVTVTESISIALTTSDQVWSVNAPNARPVAAINSFASAVSIWLPKDVPIAVTVDGNTTACRISVSGVKTNHR